MNKGRILIFVGSLIIVGVLLFYFTLTKPQEHEEFPILTAIPVFHSNLTITSEDEALEVFIQYLNNIMENTRRQLDKYGKPHEAEVIQEMNFFVEFISKEERGWENDQYWLGPNKTAYVLVMPATSKYEKWEKREEGIFVERVRCKDLPPGLTIAIPANISTYEDVKDYLSTSCPSGIEVYWTKTELYIKYLMDKNGTIYWAGQFLRTKPWLSY